MPGKMRSKQPKGMSPKHVRKSHLCRSSGNGDPIFPATSKEKLDAMSPESNKVVRNDARFKLAALDEEARAREIAAKRRLFSHPLHSPSSSDRAAVSPKKKIKKRNNKGEAVSPGSPDCGLSPSNPGRNGLRKSKGIIAYSPETNVQHVD